MIGYVKRLFRLEREEIPIQKDCSEWRRIDRLFRHKFADVQVYEADTFLYLYILEVDKRKRQQGIGSTIMKRIMWYARRMKKDVVLEASDALGTSWDKLFAFYEKHGFQQGKLERIPYRHNMFCRVV